LGVLLSNGEGRGAGGRALKRRLRGPRNSPRWYRGSVRGRALKHAQHSNEAWPWAAGAGLAAVVVVSVGLHIAPGNWVLFREGHPHIRASLRRARGREAVRVVATAVAAAVAVAAATVAVTAAFCVMLAAVTFAVVAAAARFAVGAFAFFLGGWRLLRWCLFWLRLRLRLRLRLLVLPLLWLLLLLLPLGLGLDSRCSASFF
jgi:hypothetical protein